MASVEGISKRPGSKLEQLFRHLQRQKESKHEGQTGIKNVEQRQAGGENESTSSVHPTKKIFIVSNVDNKTIIDTIETEEDKTEYIRKARMKKRRLQNNHTTKNGIFIKFL